MYKYIVCKWINGKDLTTSCLIDFDSHIYLEKKVAIKILVLNYITIY